MTPDVYRFVFYKGNNIIFRIEGEGWEIHLFYQEHRRTIKFGISSIKMSRINIL